MSASRPSSRPSASRATTSRAELIERAAEATGQSRKVVEAIVTAFLAGIGEAVAQGEQVRLYDFGTFSRGERKGGTGRNPRTGEAIEIPARRLARFRPGRGLRALVGGTAA